MKQALLALPLLCGCLVGDAPAQQFTGHHGDDDDEGGQAHNPDRLAGIVSGNIYDAIDANQDAIMADLANLGVHFVRVEINRADHSIFTRISDAAARHGLELVAVVQSSSIGMNPRAGNLDTDAYAAALDGVIDDLSPWIHYFEIENEPDVFDFPNLKNDPEPFAEVTTKVYEHVVATRNGAGSPKIIGFSFNRYDDDSSYVPVWSSRAVAGFRNSFRYQWGLPDGLPCDIVGIHGYGKKGTRPDVDGFTWRGDQLNNGLDRYFATTFSDGVSIFGGRPVWFTEVGFDRNDMTEFDQIASMKYEFDQLRARPQVKAAFWYDYRDDASASGEQMGLRTSDGGAKHTAFDAFKELVMSDWI